MNNTKFIKLLKEHDMRATKNRMNVLAFVEKQKNPIGIDQMKIEFPEINDATLYRMAADFTENGIWNSFDLGHGYLDYESANRPHHHHAVCEVCGFVEEIYGIKIECRIVKEVREKTKKFASFKKPTAAIFGTCYECV